MIWLILLFVILLGFLAGGLMGAPWVPARKPDVETMLDAANLKPGQIFVELGCGDGRLVAAAARRGARAIGYEINPLLWLIAAVRNLRYYPAARVRFANFWPRKLDQADVVMAFLMPKFMPRLATKAHDELKPDARLISYIFALPDKKPSERGRNWFIYHY